MTTNGTASNDTINVSTASGNQDVFGLAGNDSITSGIGADTLRGGFGADTIRAGSGNDVVYGNDGTENASDGADQLYGDLGNDSVAGDTGNDTLYGGRGISDGLDGNDTIRGGAGNDLIYANAGDDKVTGNDGADTIYGGVGSNVIYGDNESTAGSTGSGDGADLVFAGTGNDTVYGGAGNDTIYGGGGTTVTTDGADKLNGGDGNDLIYANAGSDTVDGGAGNDSIYAGSGNDNLTGGSGSDVFYLYNLRAGETKTITDFSATQDRVSLVDSSVTSVSQGVISAVSGGSQIVFGGAGGIKIVFNGLSTSQITDTVFGFNKPGEAVTLPGGGGGGGGGGGSGPVSVTRTFTTANPETLTGGTLGDTFNGTAANIQSGDVANGLGGTDTVKITGGGTVNLTGVTLTSIEEVKVNDTNATTITIGTYDGSVTGGTNNDTFNIALGALSSADTINGTSGTDTVNITGGGTIVLGTSATGLSNIDNLSFAAASTVTGDSNNYSITGSGGDDRFNYAAANFTSADTVVGNGGNDTLNISTAGTSINTTNVSDVDNLTLANGTNTVTVGSNNFNITGGSGNDTLQYTAANLTSADTVNGNGGADTITLTSAGTSINTTNVSDVDNLNLANGTNTVTVGTNNFSITGGSGVDTLNYAAADLTSADTVVGGGGTDVINVTTNGAAINVTNVSGVHDLNLSNGGNTVTVGTDNFSITGGTGDDVFVYAGGALSSADTVDGGTEATVDTIQITGSGTVDITNVTNVEALDLTAMTGAVTLTLGTANFAIQGTANGDTFIYDDANFSSADHVDGNSGSDTLQINDANNSGYTLDATVLDGTNTREIETVKLAGSGTHTVTLVDAFVSTATGTNVTLDLNGSTATLNTSGLSGANTVTLNGDATAANELVTLAAANNANILVTAAYAANVAMTTGNNEITFNSGADYLSVNDGSSLTAADSIVGGAGNDTITVGDSASDDTAITSAVFDGDGSNGGVSGFETIDLSDTDGLTASVVLTNAYVASTAGNAVTLTINNNDISSLTTTGVTGTVTITSSGSPFSMTTASGVNNAGIVIGASETATITLGDGNNTITGGTGSETFIVQDNQLDNSDSLTGGGTGTDTLRITGSNGDVDFTSTSHTLGFETLEITADRITGTDALKISDTMVASATSTTLSLTTSGPGTIYHLDTSNVTTPANHVVINTAAHVSLADATNIVYADDSKGVSILGGTGSDTFGFTNTGFTIGDTIDGGATGTDTLKFTDATTITTADLTNITAIETISLLAGSANTIALTDAFVGAANGGTADQVTISNGTATVSLDASNVTTVGNRVIIGGTGLVTLSAAATKVMTASGVDNAITGSSGDDTIITKNGHLDAVDTITGSGGNDTLQFDDATTLSFATANHISSFENLSFQVNGSSITLTDAFVGATGLHLVGVGNTTTATVSTAGVTHTVTVDQGYITLGTGDDKVTIADTASSVAGGNGNDRLIFAQAESITTADTLAGGANSDAIITTDTSETLNMANGNDLTNVTTVELVAMVGDTGTDQDVSAIITMDATSEVSFLLVDGTVSLAASATTADTILATDTITMASGGAITLADISGTVAHTASTAYGAGNELEAVLNFYTGGTVVTGANGTVAGGTGDDAINIVAGTAASTSVSGGGGDDTITTDNGTFANGLIIDGGSGTNTVVFTDAITTALTTTAATDGNKENIDVIQLGTSGNTVSLAASIADNISDNSGHLTIATGGSGNTITTLLVAAVGNDVTISGGLTATVTGASEFHIFGNSTLDLTSGANDSIIGGTGTVDGGNDTWTTNETALDGSDTLSGGDGTNILIINENGTDGIDLSNGQLANLDTIETIRLGTVTAAQDSAITLGANANSLAGSNAADILTLDLNGQDSGGKTVTLTIDAATNANTYTLIDSTGGSVIATLGAGTASKVAIGDADGSSITGGSANDLVTGFTGADTLIGNAGDDTLDGGAGDDTLSGGTDNDLLIFGSGSGQATGGTGDDVFRFTAAAGSSMAIQDFSTGGGNGLDKIQFDQSEGFAFGTKVVNTAFQVGEIEVGTGFSTSSSASTANTFLLYDSTDREIFYDADANGSGHAVLLGTLQAGYVFNFTDFQFVS